MGATSFMKYRIAYERSLNVVASSLAMVAQRLPFLKNLSPIFGARGGVNLAAPLAVTYAGTHALSGQSLTLVPVNGSTNSATATVGEGFLWTFKLSDDRYIIKAFDTQTSGAAETLPGDLEFTGPQSRIYFFSGFPTTPGVYEISIVAYRFANKVGDKTAPFELTLTVEPDASPYDEFIGTFWSGGDLSNPELVAPAADPDGDGIENALEFVLDLDPTKADAMPGTIGVDPNDATMLRYEIPLNALAGATSVVFEESPDLQGAWDEVPTGDFTRTDELIVLGVPLTGKKFYRLKVTLE